MNALRHIWLWKGAHARYGEWRHPKTEIFRRRSNCTAVKGDRHLYSMLLHFLTICASTNRGTGEFANLAACPSSLTRLPNPPWNHNPTLSKNGGDCIMM